MLDRINELFKAVGMKGSDSLSSVVSYRPQDRADLRTLVDLRNDLAHGGNQRVTVRQLENDIRLVERLTRAIDRAVADWLADQLPERPWSLTFPALGDPLRG